MTESTDPSIAELLPKPDAVRDRLAVNAREREILKSLLRLSQRASKQKSESAEGAREASDA